MQTQEIPHVLDSFGDALDAEIDGVRLKLLQNYSGFQANALEHAGSELEMLKFIMRYELEGLKNKLAESSNELTQSQALHINKAMAVIRLQSLVMSIAEQLEKTD